MASSCFRPSAVIRPNTTPHGFRNFDAPAHALARRERPESLASRLVYQGPTWSTARFEASARQVVICANGHAVAAAKARFWDATGELAWALYCNTHPQVDH